VDVTFDLLASDITIEGLPENVSKMNEEIQRLLHGKSTSTSSGLYYTILVYVI